MVIKPEQVGKFTPLEKKQCSVLEEIIDNELKYGHLYDELKSKEGVIVRINESEQGKGMNFLVTDKILYEVIKKYEKEGFEVKIEKYDQKAKYKLHFYVKEK